MTTLTKKLKLPWSNNPTGCWILTGKSFTACVMPILLANSPRTSPFAWKTQITVASESRVDLFAEYGGCLTEYGMRIVECFLFDRSIGIPHFQKELRELSRGKAKSTRPSRRGKVAK